MTHMKKIRKHAGRGWYARALAEVSKKSPDYNRALALLEKSIRGGDMRAAYALGTWYLHGAHLRRSLRRAVPLLRRAARAGVRSAHYDLAVCYETGTGTPKNVRLALRHYLMAALGGDSQAVRAVGRCYYHGIGCAADHEVGLLWTRRAKMMDAAREVG